MRIIRAQCVAGTSEMAPVEFQAVLQRFSSTCSSKNLNESYKDFNLELVDKIPFINDLFQFRGPVMLVKRKTDATFVSKTSSQDVDLDLTGSPLKDNFNYEEFEITQDVDSHMTTIPYKPVDLKNARHFISAYNQCGFNLPTIGVPCDGARENIIFLACTRTKSGLNWKSVTLCPPSNGKSKHSFETLKAKHLKGLKNIKIQKVEVKSSYDFTRSSDIPRTEIFTVNFQWENCKEVFEAPSSNALCTLIMKGNPNRPESIIYKCYQELKSLEVLSVNYEDSIQVNENKVSEVKEKLQYLLEDMKNLLTFRMKSKEKNGDVTALPFGVKQREMDLTDYIWNILKDYYNMPELINECIKFIVNQCRHLRHMVFKDNCTKLVKIISGEINTLITKEFSLECLLEIGIKKLHRDYINFFVGKELVTKENIGNAFESTSVTHSESINQLKKMHYIIDLVTTCSDSFNLNGQWLRLLTKHLLNEMKTKSECDRIEFQIPTYMIVPLVSRDNFDKWQVELSSDENSFKKVTTYQINRSWPNWIENDEDYCHVISEEMWDKIVT